MIDNINVCIIHSMKSAKKLNASQLINRLNTDDTIWRRLSLAACYQLAQSVLKIGFALAKKVG